MSGKAIPMTRLKAIPAARFTVECQSEMERQRKQTKPAQKSSSSPLGKERGLKASASLRNRNSAVSEFLKLQAALSN